MHLPFQSTETFYMCLFILYPSPYHLAAPTKPFATHNEWAASPPCCGYPRSGHTLYSNLFEADQILYSSLFAGMKSSGHDPLFIRTGCSRVRAEVGWPRSRGVCVRKCVWKKGQLNITVKHWYEFILINIHCELIFVLSCQLNHLAHTKPLSLLYNFTSLF